MLLTVERAISKEQGARYANSRLEMHKFLQIFFAKQRNLQKFSQFLIYMAFNAKKVCSFLLASLLNLLMTNSNIK